MAVKMNGPKPMPKCGWIRVIMEIEKIKDQKEDHIKT